MLSVRPSIAPARRPFVFTLLLVLLAAPARAQPGDVVDPLPEDYDQVRDGLPPNSGGIEGGNCCGPTSGADLLKWLGDNGFPLVWSWGTSEAEVTGAIWDIALTMDPTTTTGAVSPTELRSGLQEILDAAYPFEFTVNYYGRDSDDPFIDDAGRDFAEIIAHLDADALAIARIGWYHLDPPAPTGYGRRCNGHFVAITGYDQTAGEDWVRFMDPARNEECQTSPPPCVMRWKTTLETLELQDTGEGDAGPFSTIEASKWHYERVSTTCSCSNGEIRTPVQDGFAIIVQNMVFTLPDLEFRIIRCNLPLSVVDDLGSVIRRVEALAVDPRINEVFYCGLDEDALFRINLLTGVGSEFQTQVPVIRPRDLAFGWAGTLYVLHRPLATKAEDPHPQILAFAPDGGLRASVDVAGEGAFAYHDKTRRIYWWNGENNQLQVYSWDLRPMGPAIALPPSPEFTMPAHLAADPGGDVLYFNHDGRPLIFRFDLATGAPLPPLVDQELTDPEGMVVGDGGQLYVVQKTMGSVLHFSRAGVRVLDSPVSNVQGRRLLALNRPPRSSIKTSTNPGDQDIDNVDPDPVGVAQIPFRSQDDLGLTARPNPFNPSVEVRFELPEPCRVTLEVFDVSGRRVRTLIPGTDYLEGPQSVIWNGEDDQGRVVSSGVYLCQLKAGSLSMARTIALVR